MTSSFAPIDSSTPYTQHQLTTTSTFDFPSNRGKSFSKFYKTLINQIDSLYRSIVPNFKLYRSTATVPAIEFGGTYNVTIDDIISGLLIFGVVTVTTTVNFTTIASEDILSRLRNNCYDIGTPVLRLFIQSLNGSDITLNGTEAPAAITITAGQGVYVLVYLNDTNAKYVPI